ncbi:hypothetical protein Bbelb_206510 [Branchiostoma belcheri]|nr:hypothetical protein Bbelb_206510 [Branchiostoma belcheri]
MQRFAKFKAKLQAWKDRQLTLFGKTLVVNSIATATLWYIAPVYPLPPSVKVKIEKEIHHFLWDGKTEVVARRTLLLPKEKGGLGLVSVPLKAKALLLKSVKKALANPQLPVSRFAHYWIGLALRRIDVETWSNNAPHSLDCPAYFAEIKRLLNSLADKGIDWKSTSVSALYNILLEAEDIVPLCVRADSRVDWLAVWKVIHNPLLNKWERMTSWHAAHNSLKTRLKLYSWRRFVSDRSCPRRGCTQDESVLHLFWECAGISDVWLWLTSLVARKISPGFFPTASFALYGLVPAGLSARVTRVLQALSAFMRSFLWRTRCDCVFEKKQHSGSELVNLFKTHLRDRLNFEFARLGPSGFLTVWADGFTWARVDIADSAEVVWCF